MHNGPEEARSYVKDLCGMVQSEEGNSLAIFPPALCAFAVNETLQGSQISWGGQNAHFKNSGAFTGENSPEVFQQMGARYVLVGHSERRQVFFEPEDFMGQKVKALQDVGLIPVLCVGETIDDRKWGRTSDVISRQLKSGLSQVDLLKPLFVAYEPVWAIGTGEVATTEQVSEAHNQIRDVLLEVYEARGTEIPILYGGSVKPNNCASLAILKEVNGFLVGGASLNPKDFLEILRKSL